jgi:hypothetical protein
MEKGEGCQTAKSRSAADDRRRQEAVAQRREEEAKRRRLVAHGLSRQRHKRRIVFASDSDSDGGQGQQKKPATKQMADFIGEGRRTEEIDDENEEEVSV